MERIHDILNKIGSTIVDNQIMENTAEDSMLELEDYQAEFLGMSISSLKNILYSVSKILENIDNDQVKQNLTESWLQGMIAITENNMSTIKDFVMFSDKTDDNSSEGASKNLPGLWENIRRKKEREGKKYKPAKRGDKDRPDPEAWKNLTDENKEKKKKD
jgi:hypothetical protein